MLTKEQQQMVADSVWVVDLALKRQRLSRNEDLRQSALLYLCKCVQSYNASCGVKWTTYAYKNAFLFIKREFYKETIKTATLDLDDLAPTIADTTSTLAIQQALITCTPQERQVLQMQINGYTLNDMTARIGCCRQTVRSRLKRAKTKAREVIKIAEIL